MNTYLQNRTDLAMDIDDYHWQWEYADDVRDEIAAMIEMCIRDRSGPVLRIPGLPLHQVRG